MIKYIHCFGTSYTAGGGHEFDATGPSRSLNSSRPEARKHLENLIEVYSKKYPNEEQTLYNCSWPGQLQKLLGEDIQVINHAKSGYGNERMYEITYDIVSKPDFNKDEHLFLYEFSALGRKQLWSNTLNQYIITNYIIDDTNYCSMQFIKDKGGYNVIKAFGSDFLDMMKKYTNDGIIKIDTFEKIRKDLSIYFFPKVILKNIILKVEKFETKNLIKHLNKYYTKFSILKMFISSFFVFRIYLKNKFKWKII